MDLAEQTMQEGFRRGNRLMFHSFKLQTDNGTEAFIKSRKNLTSY